MTSHINADKEIAKVLKEADRKLYKTYRDIKKMYAEINLKYLFDNPKLSELLIDNINQIDKTLRKLENEYRLNEDPKDRQLFRWFK